MTSSLEKIVIDWMSNKGAPEWHGVAVNWNWDNGVEPLLWIVDQLDCDKATALTVFWWAGPVDQIDKNSKVYNPQGEVYKLVHTVLGNWEQYRTARFKFRLPSYTENLNSPNWGLSQECLEILKPMLINVNGQERYPNYGQSGPQECYIAYLEQIGEPVSDLNRQILESERAGQNLSQTDEEAAAAYQREMEEWVSELEDMVTIAEKLKNLSQTDKEAAQRELEEWFSEREDLLTTVEKLQKEK
ncbi:MAG TPA: DUF4274 domain-containing protein [Pyrinomonadaceae bacterium]|nr:DUF4274 domain-containing protein [Pyrinomonadaceae bacterium]